MRAHKGGGTTEVGRYAITIVPTSKIEIGTLRRWATEAVLRMEPRPNLYLPHLGDSIILSYKTNVKPAEVLSAFKTALDACQSEA